MDFFVKLKLINSSSSYGNIFIDSNGRIVKVQTLITGLHYNKKTEQYYDSSVNLGKEKASRYYPKGSILQYFRHKEGISKKDFKNEVKIQKKMSKYNISPEIYEKGFFKIGKLHFCYIVMEKMDLSLKTFMEKNSKFWSEIKEDKMTEILNIIEKLHSLGYYHGDLQPSNVCLNVKDNSITKCRLIDWFFSGKIKNDDDRKQDYNTLE